MILSNFINELGNKIKIKIKNQKNIGISDKTKESISFNGICITISGTNSMSENIITRKEAEELYFALHHFLNKDDEPSYNKVIK